MRNKIIVLCGYQAGGKDTILRELVDKYNYSPLISYTSRPKRVNEVEGKEYYFVSTKKMLELKNNSKLIEMRAYHTLVNNKPDTWYYGLGKDEVDLNKKQVVILDKEGLEAFIDYLGKENVYVVLINCNENIRLSRCLKRGSFNQPEWDRREKADKKSFSGIKELSNLEVDTGTYLSTMCAKKINSIVNEGDPNKTW